MKVFVVETKDTLFWSERKMDATYKHVQFLYGQAKFYQVDKSELSEKGKKIVQIQLDEEF